MKTQSGAEGDRTLNLRIANAALSQLSYRPNRITGIKVHCLTLVRKLRWPDRPGSQHAAPDSIPPGLTRPYARAIRFGVHAS